MTAECPILTMPTDEQIVEIAKGNGQPFERVKQRIENNHKPAPNIAAVLKRAITSGELLEKSFAPMAWLVPDIVPAEGLTVLGAKMGMGKSFFLLQLAHALSMGTPFLGRETRRQGVLYLALEDSERRIKARLNMLGFTLGTDLLFIATTWGKKDAIGDLKHMLNENQGIRCVIIDPIVRFLSLVDENSYAESYGALGPLKEALDVRQVGGIFSHHCKKSIAELDAFDDLLGSTGWGAACDSRLVLRRQRGSPEATLVAGGRDVMHSESALLFDGANGWTYQGAAEDVRMSDERREILDLLEDGPLSATEIAKKLEKNYKTTSNLLRKMLDNGKIVMDSGKKYRKAMGNVGTRDTEPVALPIVPTVPIETTTLSLPTAKRGEEPSSEPALFPEIPDTFEDGNA